LTSVTWFDYMEKQKYNENVNNWTQVDFLITPTESILNLKFKI
jgi:hypothetical protein